MLHQADIEIDMTGLCPSEIASDRRFYFAMTMSKVLDEIIRGPSNMIENACFCMSRLGIHSTGLGFTVRYQLVASHPLAFLRSADRDESVSLEIRKRMLKLCVTGPNPRKIQESVMTREVFPEDL